VYVHIGLTKTGTSYLQRIAWSSRDELERQGLALVPETRQEAYALMRELRGLFEDEAEEARMRGTLARLPRSLERAAGRGAAQALISEELLAAAWAEEADRLVDTLAGHEVHVVVTARDIARQLPSVWQQRVKSRGKHSYSDFLEAVREGRGTRAERFQRSQDVVGVLDRWGRRLPAERVHVVTVPPRGSAPTVLAERFFSLFGIAADTLDLESREANTSIGRVQAELLARVNARLPEEGQKRLRYGDVGKRYFAERVLSAQGGTPARLPASFEPWCREQAEQTIAALRERGYHVVGDLDDLMPGAEAFAETPEQVEQADLLEAAEQAIAQLLLDRMDATDQARARLLAKRQREIAAREQGSAPTGAAESGKRRGLARRGRRG